MSAKTIALSVKLDESLNEVAKCAEELCNSTGKLNVHLEYEVEPYLINDLKLSLDKWRIARKEFLDLVALEIARK